MEQMLPLAPRPGDGLSPCRLREPHDYDEHPEHRADGDSNGRADTPGPSFDQRVAVPGRRHHATGLRARRGGLRLDSRITRRAVGGARPGRPREARLAGRAARRRVVSTDADRRPDGSVHVGENGDVDIGGFALHRLGVDGRELPGWPFRIAPPAGCHDPVVALDGTAYLACWSGDGGKDLLYAIDPEGHARDGWPVAIDGLVLSSRLMVTTDGTVFISTWPEGLDGASSLSALGPDGRPRPGWPVSLSPHLGDYLLGPDGSVVVWWDDPLPGAICKDASRMFYTVLGSDGLPLPGWPREGKPGWPVQDLAGYDDGCTLASPYLRPDGTVYFHADEVTALSPDGRPRPGWPVRPAGSLGPRSSCDADAPMRPRLAFGPGGSVYLAVFHEDPAELWADVLALDRDGRVLPGWPHRLPLPLGGGVGVVRSLDVAPNGRLYVTLVTCTETPDMLLVLDADGSAVP